jgi:hypothetical protein
MFVAEEVDVDLGFPAARARLLAVTRGGWLTAASDGAYAEGLSGLIRVGPFGGIYGASKLVRVLLLEPVTHDDSVVLTLRWEATGVMGPLFPVLDANITLTPAGEGSSRLALDGAYRPPLSGVGVALDRVLLHRAAVATARSLLGRIAETLVPAGTAVADPEVNTTYTQHAVSRDAGPMT